VTTTILQGGGAGLGAGRGDRPGHGTCRPGHRRVRGSRAARRRHAGGGLAARTAVGGSPATGAHPGSIPVPRPDPRPCRPLRHPRRDPPRSAGDAGSAAGLRATARLVLAAAARNLGSRFRRRNTGSPKSAASAGPTRPESVRPKRSRKQKSRNKAGLTTGEQHCATMDRTDQPVMLDDGGYRQA
jgi:hypothetical protein